MHYLKAEFTIECSAELLQPSRELLADAIAEAGFESFEDTDKGIDAYVQEDLLDRIALDEVISDFAFPEAVITYELSDVADENYNQTWEANGFEPINIDGRLVIFDANNLNPITTDIPSIGIAAQQAFGTGTHETTRMIVRQLLDTPLEGKRILDCGCGTGILGIVSAKYGAEEVVGYDIDEWSVNNTEHNCGLNNITNMQVLLGDSSVLSHVSGVFDIVLANINRNILLADMKAFKEVMNIGATLIISGFYEDDAPLLLEKAWELGLSEFARKTDSGWCMLVLR